MAENKTVRFIITRQDTPDSAPYKRNLITVSTKYERYFCINGNSS